MESDNRYFETRFTYDPRRDGVWKEICRYLQDRHIPREARIVELGAGYCHFINNIQGCEKHAVDLGNQITKYAHPFVKTHVQNCTDLRGLADGTFDIVFASNLFEHLTAAELTKTLGEVRRILRDGGRLIVLQPNFKYCCKHYFDDYTHIQIFTHLGLCALLAASGFTVCGVKPRFLPFSMKSRLPIAPFLVRLYLHLPFKPFAGQMLIVAKHQQ
jgi:SAM-dependent methyltransferase